MVTTKITEDGRVYARHELGDGRVVVEKIDPRIVHDAPPTVASGTTIAVTFTMVDFDGEARSDSGGELLLDIDGTEVPLQFATGVATVSIELFASATITQQPPYFRDARMEPLTIEVVV